MFFFEYQTKLNGYQIPDWFSGEVPEEQEGFQMDLDNDIERPVEISMRVFVEVYNLNPTFDLNITEN